MTRSQFFRHLVALLLLPNVTAWQYALPRGAKLPIDRRYWLHVAMVGRIFNEQFEKVRALMDRAFVFEPISRMTYRIPLSR